MANPGPAIAGIPNTELALSTGPQQRQLWPVAASTVTFAAVNGDVLLNYFPCAYPVTASRLDALMYVSAASTTTTNTAAIAMTVNAGIYQSYLSTNTAGTTTAASLVSWGSTQTTYSYASNGSGQTQLIAAAIRPISCPVNINMTQGEYWVAFNMSTSQSSVGAATTALAFNMSYVCGAASTATPYAEFSQATASTSGLNAFQGVYTTTTGALPVTLANSNVVQTGASLNAGNYVFVLRNY